MSQIMQAIDERQSVQLDLLDLSKAFDTVDHSILISKLCFYGIRGMQIQLFESYLSRRKQFVMWQETKSPITNVKYGVPQGSILGPLLFLIYVNDLPASVNENICLYADDTSILVKGNDIEDLDRKSINAIRNAQDWFSNNKLKQNNNKTESIIFSTKKNYATSEVKFLGLHIDSELGWVQHTTTLCKRLTSVVYTIRRLKKVATHETAKVSYNSCFHSVISYGILFWAHSPGFKRVFCLQKKAVRALCNLKQRDSCKPYFVQQNILTLPSVYILTVLLYVYDNIEQFNVNGQHHEYATRKRVELRVPYHRLTRTQHAVDFWGPKFYNKLPAEVKGLPRHKYKSLIKKYLIDNSFYNYEDFLGNEISM